MSDKFSTISIERLYNICNTQLDNKSYFGIPEELFYKTEKDKFSSQLFGNYLETQLGLAAGPHTQMAQNIIGAWLCGARYIELKTVQVLDDLEISKPCIDMQDVGYNCEWSQELKIEESFEEYLKAWVLIHLFNYKLNRSTSPCVIFNISVGYDYAGITSPKMQWFLDKIEDCSFELNSYKEKLRVFYPEIDEIDIPTKIANSVTLSTMHGCPSEEIQQIAEYLLKSRGLNTLIKLNPTLLGANKLREILNEKLAKDIHVPDESFEHDLKWEQAVDIISSLQATANKENLIFGLKVCNTLEVVNNSDKLKDNPVYMSGYTLHPIAISLVEKLRDKFGYDMLISFSAGVDAFNFHKVVAAGLSTVTVCSDILKPGGYGKLQQYLDILNDEMNSVKAHNINEFICKRAENHDLHEASAINLKRYHSELLSESGKNEYSWIEKSIKSDRELGFFDCIHAPCVSECATHQDVPEYMYFAGKSQFKNAIDVILKKNPFPAITGNVCDHLCQNKCTRMNYEQSLHIREVKRYIAEKEQGKEELPVSIHQKEVRAKVAIIGAGPAGLSCAYYLALDGIKTYVYESGSKPGGMVDTAIPEFRLAENAIISDMERLKKAGVQIHYNHNIDKTEFANLLDTYEAIFVGSGAPRPKRLNIQGINNESVIDVLQFLQSVKAGDKIKTGDDIAVIGGGNTAIDAVRTALRLIGKSGKVTLLYRRTIKEMPADIGEIKAALEEGMNFIELASPLKITKSVNKLILECVRMELSEKDKSGRLSVKEIKDSNFDLTFDTIIPAIGQEPDLSFITDESYFENEIIFIGGDAKRGASTAINAIADGRQAASDILRYLKANGKQDEKAVKSHSARELRIKKARKINSPIIEKHSETLSFTPDILDYSESDIVNEANRCLHCDELCDVCVSVCPNFANYSYDTPKIKINLDKIIINEGRSKLVKDKIFEIKQVHQILHIDDFCNECGNCNSFCPSNSAPYIDKPKFYLNQLSYEKALNGYFISKNENNNKKLHAKYSGEESSLLKLDDKYIYSNDIITAEFSLGDFSLQAYEFKNSVGEFSFEQAAEMMVLIEGAKDLF